MKEAGPSNPALLGLNPCSNGMTIEYSYLLVVQELFIFLAFLIPHIFNHLHPFDHFFANACYF